MLRQLTGVDTRYCPAAVRVLVVAIFVWLCMWQVLVQVVAVLPPQVKPHQNCPFLLPVAV